MVLEIRLENFYSIHDEAVLELRAGNIKTQKAKELSDNVIEYNGIKVLKSVAIYGANASGKSNLIKAIRFCCSMVFSSHLNNENSVFAFEPFKFSNPQKPSSFFIRFLLDDIEYEYSFSLTTTEIITESLFHYPNGRRAKVFERDEQLGEEKKEKYSFSNVIKRPLDIAENTSNKTLYISRASQMDRELGKKIFNYFSNTFILGYLGYNNQSIESLLINNKDFLLKALQIADSDIADIHFKKEKISTRSVYVNLSESGGEVLNRGSFDDEKIRLVTYHKSVPNVPFDFELEESDGTKKLFYALLSIKDILDGNKILLVDEIETHLHSNIVDFIVELFHSSDRSQLIYSTHNTNLLDLNKLRRDQIYFVNKNEQGSSELYSLYDYKDFRENMDAEKGYLQGRFDAIPFVNLSKSSLKALVHE